MPGDDEKRKAAQAASGEPRKLDRREVLKGLSTVPALGLFGYAWQRQRQYQQAKLVASAAPVAPADLQEINVALIGAGAQGQVLTDAMLRIPGLRFRAVCDVWAEYNQKRVVNSLKKFKHEVNGYEDYREMLDKEKEIDAVVIATPDFWHSQHAVDCLKAGKHVYCEKEMSNTHRGRAGHGGGRPRDRQAPPDRPPAPLEPALPPLLREAPRRGEAARPDRDRQRAVEPRGGAGPRGPRSLRDPGGSAQAVRLQGHAPVPQLALVQGPGRRADRGPRLAPDRHLHLVPRRQPLPRDGERRAPLPRPEDARVVRHGHGRLRLRHPARAR